MVEISATNFDCKDSIFLDTAKIYSIFFALKIKIMGTRERFYEVRDALGLTDYKMQTSIEGITKSMLDKLRQGIVTEVSIKILMPFIEAYPQVNVNYILTGRGSMFNQEQEANVTDNTKSDAKFIDANVTILVPLVNQYAYAGYLNGYQDNTYMDSLPTIPFMTDHEMRGNYIAFEVKGDSMNNGTEESYLEGDRLFCREIPQHLWVDSKLHIRKWDFVIVHEDGILVKRIIDHDVQNHTITVHSLNDFYPDKVIDLAEVRQIFNVVEMQRPKRR